MNARYARVLGFCSYISSVQLLLPYVSVHLNLFCMSAFFMISSSFLVLRTDRSTVLVHQPLLSLNPGISHSESIYSLRCSPINQAQHKLENSRYQILRQRGDTTHPYPQLPKKINNHLLTTRQIGDSQPFSPLELIAMYAEKDTVPKMRQQTGDNLAKRKEIL